MAVCLNIEIHEIHKLYEIHIGKAVNKPTDNCYSIDINLVKSINTLVRLYVVCLMICPCVSYVQ